MPLLRTFACIAAAVLTLWACTGTNHKTGFDNLMQSVVKIDSAYIETKTEAVEAKVILLITFPRHILCSLLCLKLPCRLIHELDKVKKFFGAPPKK